MSHFAAVAIPVSHGVAIVSVIIPGAAQCPQHHIFVISQNHFCVGHGHDFSQDANTAGVAVNHISKDIECVLTLQIDLFQNRIEPALVAVNVRKHIYHWGSPVLCFFDYMTWLSEQSSGVKRASGGFPIVRNPVIDTLPGKIYHIDMKDGKHRGLRSVCCSQGRQKSRLQEYISACHSVEKWDT